jgi:hypothetical protein
LCCVEGVALDEVHFVDKGAFAEVLFVEGRYDGPEDGAGVSGGGDFLEGVEDGELVTGIGEELALGVTAAIARGNVEGLFVGVLLHLGLSGIGFCPGAAADGEMIERGRRLLAELATYLGVRHGKKKGLRRKN